MLFGGGVVVDSLVSLACRRAMADVKMEEPEVKPLVDDIPIQGSVDDIPTQVLVDEIPTEPQEAASELKRKLSVSKKSNKRRKQPFSAKQPLQALNEHFGKVDFNMISLGDTLGSGFKAICTIDGVEFEASGPTKIKARREAAEKCLTTYGVEFCHHSPAEDKLMQPVPAPRTGFMQNSVSSLAAAMHTSMGSSAMSMGSSSMDFSRDYTSFGDGMFANPSLGQSFDDVKIPPLQAHVASAFAQNLQHLRAMKISFSLEKAMEFPSMAMHELFPDINDKIVWIDTGSLQKFHCKAEIYGQVYFGLGLGKRQAKKELAKSILSVLLGIRNFTQQQLPVGKKGNTKPLNKKHPFAQVKQIHPEAEYEFREIKDEAGAATWYATLKANGTIYEASDAEKSKAKFKVSKMACQNYHETHTEEIVMIKSIDTGKHPVQMLHEYYGDIKFIEQDISEKNTVKFLIGIEIDGQTFTVEASSKKKGKLQLAMKVFEEVNEIDPSAWSFPTISPKSENDNSEPMAQDATSDMESKPTAALKSPVGLTSPATAKSPIAVLNELHPDLEYTFAEAQGSNNQPEFVATIQFGGVPFLGLGASKKVAKSDVAAKVLDEIYGIQNVSMETNAAASQSTHTDIENDFSDKIVQAVYSKFSEIFPSDISCKVVGAVIMAKSLDGVLTESFQVISIGTGTKCIVGDSINNSGQALNDCHAEVIACRGLRQFLFDQMGLALDGKENCFERIRRGNFFQLKPNLHLYLYVSTAPCGDGRIYNNTTVSSKNKTIGVLRTKIENGQGNSIIEICWMRLFFFMQVVLSSKHCRSPCKIVNIAISHHPLTCSCLTCNIDSSYVSFFLFILSTFHDREESAVASLIMFALVLVEMFKWFLRLLFLK